MIETLGYFGLTDLFAPGPVALSHVPMAGCWAPLLAVLLLAALASNDSFQQRANRAGRLPGLCSLWRWRYVTSAAFIAARDPGCEAGALFSRLGNAARILFVLAAIFFYRRYQQGKKSDSDASLYDYSLFLVALLNVCCHIAALFSRRLFDGPFFLAELSKVASYSIMLCGALIDQARLFDQFARWRKRSTHRLANYRRCSGDRIGIGPLPATQRPLALS